MKYVEIPIYVKFSVYSKFLQCCLDLKTLDGIDDVVWMLKRTCSSCLQLDGHGKYQGESSPDFR